MSEKNRDHISFSSVIEGKKLHTFIDLKEENMTIRELATDEVKEKILFFGTVAEFKKLELIKEGRFNDRIYSSILDQSERLIAMLTKA